MREPHHREAFAFEIVHRVLGCEVEHRDDGTADRQGEVDAHIHLANGNRAALEVTVAGDPEVMEIEAVLRTGDRDRYPGLRWLWMVRPERGIRFEEFDRHLEVLLRASEAQGQREPARLVPSTEPEAEARAWYMRGDLEVSCLGPPSTGAGAVDVLPPTMGGAVDEQLDGLGDWIELTLSTGSVARRVSKLGASGLGERHLYVIVHSSGMAFPTYCGLTFETNVPPAAPALPDEVTHLWIDGGYRAGGVLRWAPDTGWSRHHPYE